MNPGSQHSLELLHHTLLEGKLPRNLSWDAATELIRHLGAVEAHGANQFAFSVGSERAFFKRPHSHELEPTEVSRLRSFLRAAATQDPVEHAPAAEVCRMVVVVDHHVAHIYQEAKDRALETADTVKVYDPFHFEHHLIHRKEAQYRGERIPERASFYDEIAQDLAPATEIVLVGHGTGDSSAALALVNYLETHHSTIARRLRATVNADLSALTVPQMEALAMQHMRPAA